MNTLNELTLGDWFCGAGGATQGAHAVPGIAPRLAANHDALAIETHATNFPDVEHYQGDIRDVDVAKHPHFDIFWASPECTNWSVARGKPQDYARQPGLWDEPEPPEDVQRSRALMQDVIRYLRGMNLRQRPVLAGVVENVVDIRRWVHWPTWRREIEVLGYRTRLIALNSMHAQSARTPRAPQSRDRLYLAYWHTSLGRDPDWDRWLRPLAWCGACDREVAAVQTWKRPGVDMGRYRQQYVYTCPRVHRPGQPQTVEPYFVPAASAIDWKLPGERIGDRAKPLADKTLARISAGIRRYARPISLEAAGHTFERRPGVRTWPVGSPLTTQSTTSTKAVAVPPLVVPVEGRDGKHAVPADSPMRTQTARNETGLAIVPPMLVPAGGTWNDTGQPLGSPMRARTTRDTEAVVVPPLVVPLRTHGTSAPADEAFKTFVAGNAGMAAVIPPMVMRNNTPRPGDPGYLSQPVDRALGALTTAGHQSLVVPPFIAELRGGGSDHRPVTEALATFAASGTHHGLVTMQAWAALYGYDTGALRDLARPLPTQTTVEGDAVIAGGLPLPAVEDCLFRMLEPHEIHAGMAFTPGYVVLGNKRQQVRQLGNAVTPPVAEVLVAALVECITGELVDLAAA